MSEEDILQRLSTEKERAVRKCLALFLGHEPNPEERRRFTVVSSLLDTHIYFNGSEICHLKFHAREDSILVEYRHFERGRWDAKEEM